MDGSCTHWNWRRLLVCIGLAAGLSTLWLAAAASSASATAVPEKTDVMFVFDTSGSMGSVLEEAKAEVQEVMGQIAETVPNPAFGVAEVKDTEEETLGFYAWKLDQAVTTNTAAVKAAIEPLTAEAGGDGPEAYGRALFETSTNPDVGWRAGAKHLIVLVADEVPHMKDVNEGIPPEFQLTEGPGGFTNEEAHGEEPTTWPDTGYELEEAAGIKDTKWKPGVKIQFNEDLETLVKEQTPLEMVDIHDTEGDFVHYWEHWAGVTGGKAVEATEGGHDLATALSTITEEGVFGTLPSCPAGQRRNAKDLCVPLNPTATQVICNLVVATASDTCTATVGDAATTEVTNPTGTVTFTSASGGTFPAGNTCALAKTPLSGNTSSCSVEFLPPSAPSPLPAITAAYGGDAIHAGSSGSTHYGAADELATLASLSEAGTVKGGEVDLPISCGFPCTVGGDLFSGPDLGGSASVGGGHVLLLAEASSSHGKKKKKQKPKPVLLGVGTLKLAAPGKGKLVIHLNGKAKAKFLHISSKGVRLTLKYTIKTPDGTLVTTGSRLVRIKPARKSGKKKH